MSIIYSLCAIFLTLNNTLCDIEKRKIMKVDELEFWKDTRHNSRRYIQYRRVKENNLTTNRPVTKKFENVQGPKRKPQNVSKGGFRSPPHQNSLTSRKVKNGSKSHRGVFRGHSRWSKMNVTWPKIAPQFRAKPASKRFTKMMLQEASDVSTQYTPLDDEVLPEFLNPYGIKQQLSRISSKFPSTNMTLEVIGRTVEYKDIILMKISEMTDLQRHFRAEDDKYADEPPQKKIVFIVHGLSVMGIHSVNCLSIDDDFTKLLSYYLTHLDHFDIFLIPLANPDGIAFSRHKAFWNKNVSIQNACPGVHVDRNFDVAWNHSHAISSCSQQYPGIAPFTEAESRAIRDVFHKYSHKIVAYLHVHGGSYEASTYKGEAVLYPKGFSEIQSDDDKYIDLKADVDEVIRNASFKEVSVTVDTLYNWYGKVFGSSVDYASTIYGIPYSLELVMQLYTDSTFDTEESYAEIALEEIWQRVIDVIFKNIWKHMHETDK